MNTMTAAEWNAVNPVGTRVLFAGRVAFTVAQAVARVDFTSGKERGGYVECREPGETGRYPTRLSLCSLIPISANPARDTPKPIARGEYAAVKVADRLALNLELDEAYHVERAKQAAAGKPIICDGCATSVDRNGYCSWCQKSTYPPEPIEIKSDVTYPPDKIGPVVGPLKEVKDPVSEQYLTAIARTAAGRVPSPDEAREILSRFNNSHFDNKGPKARMSIPARPDHDDDILMAAFIDEAERTAKRLAELEEEEEQRRANCAR